MPKSWRAGLHGVGSDQIESPVVARLRSLGVVVHIGHQAEHVEHADVIVVSAAVPEDNPERVAARSLRIPVVPRAEMLANSCVIDSVLP